MQPFDSDATDQVVDFIVLSRLRLSALYIHRSMSKQIKTEILYIDSPKKTEFKLSQEDRRNQRGPASIGPGARHHSFRFDR